MIGKVEELVREARGAASVLKPFPDRIRLISHYDADGICSAAIMVRALAREGKDFFLSFANQLRDKDVAKLAEEKNKLIVFLDLGSGHLKSIEAHLLKDTRVVVSDHHQIQGNSSSENLFHVNPVNMGITENISGSGVTYLIARALNPENRDLSGLAIIGAIGDSQMGSIGGDWGLFGLNREILKDAKKANMIGVGKGLRLWGRTRRPIHKALEYSFDPYIPGVSGSESSCVQFLRDIGIQLKKENGEWKTLSDLMEDEQKRLASAIITERIRGSQENPEWVFGDVYELVDKPGFNDASEFATLLNATGKLMEGHLGVALCLNDQESLSRADKILESYRREIGKAIEWIARQIKNNGNGFETGERAHYILAGSSISEHMLSNAISTVSRSFMLPDNKPVFAFVNTEDGNVKVSARADDSLVRKGLNLKDVVVQAAMAAGGEGGGHKGAAGAIIPRDMEKEFMGAVENALMPCRTAH